MVQEEVLEAPLQRIPDREEPMGEEDKLGEMVVKALQAPWVPRGTTVLWDRKAQKAPLDRLENRDHQACQGQQPTETKSH